MGVMPCSRRGCENILSRYYSHDLGYLCEDCYDQGCKQRLDPDDFIHTDAKKDKYNVNNEAFAREYDDTEKR